MIIRLKEIRIEKRMSIRELAKLSGVSKSEISRIEAGIRIPTIFVMCKLAKALEVEVYNLFACK